MQDIRNRSKKNVYKLTDITGKLEVKKFAFELLGSGLKSSVPTST